MAPAAASPAAKRLRKAGSGVAQPKQTKGIFRLAVARDRPAAQAPLQPGQAAASEPAQRGAATATTVVVKQEPHMKLEPQVKQEPQEQLAAGPAEHAVQQGAAACPPAPRDPRPGRAPATAGTSQTVTAAIGPARQPQQLPAQVAWAAAPTADPAAGTVQPPPAQPSSAGFAELSDSQPTAYFRCTVPGTPGARDHERFSSADEVSTQFPLRCPPEPSQVWMQGLCIRLGNHGREICQVQVAVTKFTVHRCRSPPQHL